MNVVLIGFKNSGKTSVAEFISKKANKIFIDTDHLIEKNTGLTARKIYQNKGEKYFREVEKNIILNIKNDDAIIATGGGSIVYKDNVTYLKKLGKLIYLDTPLDLLLTRLELESTPVFLDAKDPEKSFKALYKKRQILYQKASDIIIFTENKSIEAISEEILALTRNL